MALVKAFLEHFNRQEKHLIDFFWTSVPVFSLHSSKKAVYVTGERPITLLEKPFDTCSNCSTEKSLDHRKQVCVQRGIKNLSIRSSVLQQAIVVITATHSIWFKIRSLVPSSLYLLSELGLGTTPNKHQDGSIFHQGQVRSRQVPLESCKDHSFLCQHCQSTILSHSPSSYQAPPQSHCSRSWYL